MANLKFALVVLLAVGACQCQAANVPSVLSEPEPRDLDIFLAAQHVIKIVRNVIGAVHKGIDESKPSIDIIVSQLTPELGKAVKKTLDDIVVLLKKEEQRIEVIIKGVETILDAIKKIKSCTDPSKAEMLKAIAKLEDNMLLGIRAALKNNSEPLNDLKIGGKRILDKARKLFDDEVKNVVVCIKPGSKDAKKCISGEIEKIKKGVIGIGADAILFLSEAQETLVAFVLEIVQRATPVIDTFVKEADPIMTKISDCISKMK